MNIEQLHIEATTNAKNAVAKFLSDWTAKTGGNEYGEPMYCGFAWVDVKVRSNSILGKALQTVGFKKSWQGGVLQLWDPALGKRAVNNPFWLDGVALEANDPSLQGGASKVVMDRALPFIESSVKKQQPFFTVIWFHAPHQDVVAGPEYLAQYKQFGESAHYYGVITEMDEQIGRLRAELKRLGVDNNTLITFTSDNGPESENIRAKNPGAGGRMAGSTDDLRGRKRDLYEGGVRVPTLALWPDNIAAGSVNNTLSSTLDYLPTINEIVGYKMPDHRPIDGTSILPLLLGKKVKDKRYQRNKAIPFIAKNKLSLIDGDYKLVTNAHALTKKLAEAELYNLALDRGETTNIAENHPKRVKAMIEQIKKFVLSAKASHNGADYSVKFKRVDEWPVKQISSNNLQTINGKYL